MEPVNWSSNVVRGKIFAEVFKENDKTLSVKNNNQSDNNKDLRIQIYDPATQVSDILRIRLLPQIFYNYTITASKDIGKNQHIWPIVDPNYKQSVNLKDSIIQALYISFISLLDAHQKAPDSIKISQEFLQHFGNSVNDLNGLSIAEKEQHIVNMFKIIGVSQDQINFENMLKLLDKLKLSHLVFTFPGISQSQLVSQSKEGFVVTKYKKNDWGSRAAPNRLAFGAIINNNNQLLRLVLVQPKDSESGVRILQSNTTGFGIVDEKDEGYYSDDNSEIEDLDSPMSRQDQNQATKGTAFKKTRAQLAQQKDIKLGAVSTKGDQTYSTTATTILPESQPPINRLAIPDNKNAESQQYTGRQKIAAAKALPESEQLKVEGLNRNAVSKPQNVNTLIPPSLPLQKPEQASKLQVNSGTSEDQAPGQPKVTIPPPPPAPKLSTTETGNNLSKQQAMSEQEILPQQYEGREGLLQQIRQGQHNLKSVGLPSEKNPQRMELNSSEKENNAQKELSHADMLKQALAKRRISMMVGVDKDNTDLPMDQPLSSKKQVQSIESQADSIKRGIEASEQPKVTIPSPPPLPPAPKLSTTATTNNLSNQEETGEEEILPQGDTQRPSNTALLGSIQNFNKGSLWIPGS